MEVPTAAFQLLSSQILLVCSLLVVESKEQAVEIHLDESALAVVNCRCWEITLLLKICLHLGYLIWVLRQEDGVLHWQGTRS